MWENAKKQSFILCLIIILLSGSFFAQNRPRRSFVGIDGPVKSVFVEVAKLIPDGDSVIEGPRILASTDEVDEEGTLTISKGYNPEGAVRSKQVTSFYPDGRANESLMYSGEERLLTRMLFYYDSGGNRMETFHYTADGTIASTSIRHLDESLSLIKSETRDENGNLREQETSNRSASGLHEQTRSLYKESKMSGKVVTIMLSPQRRGEQCYDAEGVLKSKIVTTVDHKGEFVERATYDGGGNLREKDSYEREYDARGNWIKQISLKWNPKTEKSEMIQVYYRTITYYEQ